MKIQVNIPESSQEYSIHIGVQEIHKIKDLFDIKKYSHIAIISDANVKSHLKSLEKSLDTNLLTILVPSGENNKSIETVENIWKKLAEAKFDRKSLVINLGGGVICDMGGFAASTYMRGIDFLNIPTTLLSQVDASVGGKTGIDFAGLKNIVGTFNQPKAVIIDVETLKTLPEREFNAGFAEIIKHGLIADKNYLEKVTQKKPKDFFPVELIDIIKGSCEIKKEVVEKDPTEKNLRKILNFGHTIGHAIEAICLQTDKPLLHGEAISLGMIAEAKISALKGYISENDIDTIKKCLENAGLPIKTTIANIEEIIAKLASDKKNAHGKIKWTLLKQIGEAIYDEKVNDEVVKKAIQYVL